MSAAPDERPDQKSDCYNWKTKPKRFIANNTVLFSESEYKMPDKKGTGNPNFKRYQYFFLAEKKLITHYVGDHRIAVERPHGNATKSTHPFVASSANVLTTLAQQSRRERPTDIYHTLTSNAPGGILAMIDVPHNVKQVQNVRAQLTRKLSSDLVWNAHLVNNELLTANSQVDFIRRIDTFHPDAYFMIGIDEGVQAEFKSMAQTNNLTMFLFSCTTQVSIQVDQNHNVWCLS